jgi:hypothetical protein
MRGVRNVHHHGNMVMIKLQDREQTEADMTEWNAAEYAKRSRLQETMANEVLALLELEGVQRVLDVDAATARLPRRSPRVFREEAWSVSIRRAT